MHAHSDPPRRGGDAPRAHEPTRRVAAAAAVAAAVAAAAPQAAPWDRLGSVRSSSRAPMARRKEKK